MLTIVDLIKRTTDFFAKKGIETPKVDAEWIIAHGLGCKRLELYLRFDQPLPEATLVRLRELVKRRGDREPLQHIIGSTPWGPLQLKVDRRCLVPRPETEELWDKIVEHYGQNHPATIVDLGTGTGALALAMKKSFPSSRVIAVERNTDTLALAKENAALNKLDIEFIQSDWFAELDPSLKADLIVSNPPYLTDAEWESAAPEVKDYDPKEALVAANDGLADCFKIMEDARSYLAADGQLWLEHGVAHADALAAHANKLEYKQIAHYKDANHRLRFTQLGI